MHRDLEPPDLARAVSHTLVRAVPFEGICLLTVDPATLLPTSEVVEDALPPEGRARLAEIELGGRPDFNKFTMIAKGAEPAASLSAATHGDLDRSLRQREVRRPSGFGDELRTVLTGPTGSWGTLTLLRESRRPHFTPAEVRIVSSLAPVLSDGVRRALLRERAASESPADTGVLVLDADDTVEVANAAAERWIDELSPDREAPGILPLAIGAVVLQTRSIASGGDVGLATARVRTAAGRWLVVRGSVVGPDRIGVLLEAARPAELASTLADTYGFTERERAVTALVARGESTAAIADRLHLSAYTVQDHLKAIFEKSGTGTRGELVARLYLDQRATDPASP